MAKIMPLSNIQSATIYTGNPYTLSLPIIRNGQLITDATYSVRAAIISRFRDELYAEVELSFNTSNQEWRGTFSETQTRRLLNNPLDLMSGLKASRVLIEVEVVNLAYTEHYEATVAASLIGGNPSGSGNLVTQADLSLHIAARGLGSHIPDSGLPVTSVVGLNERFAAIAPVVVPFTLSTLSVAGALPVVHGFNAYPSSIAVWINGTLIGCPDDVDYVSANAIAVYLQSFRPFISGDCRVVVSP